MQQITTELLTNSWWGPLIRVLLAYLIVYIISRFSGRIANHLVRVEWWRRGRKPLRSERQHTLRGLIANVITFLAFLVATLFSLSIFIDADTLVWMVGLFSAAFGLGARPLIADFLTGISFLFEDTFDVGEKVEMLGVEGVVEEVNLRATLLRAPTGESYIIPNGEIRMVRNFSRGLFSMAHITLQVAAADLSRTLPVLQELGKEAVLLLPNLLEPWQVVSESGNIGLQTDLMLVTKTRFGKAAEMRPRLLALVQERLEKEEISLGSG